MDKGRTVQDLIARLRAGDAAAATELYREYGSALRVIVRRWLHPRLRARFDSLDFVQDVWASFLTLPADRYAFDTPQALLAFLGRVAERKVAAVIRRQGGIDREVPAGDLEGDGGESAPPSPDALPDEWVMADEAWVRLLNCVPAGHRVLLERLREGYTYEEIARVCGVSVPTVKRIVRRLRERYGS